MIVACYFAFFTIMPANVILPNKIKFDAVVDEHGINNVKIML